MATAPSPGMTSLREPTAPKQHVQQGHRRLAGESALPPVVGKISKGHDATMDSSTGVQQHLTPPYAGKDYLRLPTAA